MRRAGRWAIVAGAAALAAGAAGCGGGSTASVPAAPGTALVDRVLGPDELGIPGYTASREPVVAQGLEDSQAGSTCDAEKAASTRALRADGFQAEARRVFQAAHGGGLSAVWQFATPAGARAWEREVLAQGRNGFPSCAPAGVTRTGYAVAALAGLPDGALTHETQTRPDGPSEAWNALFTDGRFAYVVGAAGRPGETGAAAVTAAARRAWARRGA